jgi:hypothetical protein
VAARELRILASTSGYESAAQLHIREHGHELANGCCKVAA